MDLTVRTEKQISITKKGDKIIVTEVEKTITTKKGEAPDVRVVETKKEYNMNNIPEELKSQIAEFSKENNKILPQGPSTEKRSLFVQKQEPTIITPEGREKLNRECVVSHNAYRQIHGVPPLTYSNELANIAQRWAEELAFNNKFEHSKDKTLGENIYMFYSSDPSATAKAGDACDSWYSEIKKYTFGMEPKNMDSGHFTQMIWKETKEVGMGWAKGSTGKQIIVANYKPPGNVIGSFTENVPEPTD